MPKPGRKSRDLPVDSPERRRLPILLRRAWYGLNQAFRRRIAHTGVTPDQFTAMRTILEGSPQGLVQSELSRLMASDPNTIASLIERMEKADLIERQTHEKDRRAYRIRLTRSGLRKYDEIREIAINLQTDVLSHLGEEHRETFLQELAGVADACQRVADNQRKAAGSDPNL